MSSFNQVVLMGHLTRDPELRYLPKGTAVATVGMAMNRVWTTDAGEKKEEVTFVDVDLWGKTAENTAQYMRKGSLMLVSGRLRLEQWDDKQTGQKRSRLKVTGESVQFINSPKDGSAASPRPARPAAEPTPNAAPQEGGVPEDNIPF